MEVRRQIEVSEKFRRASRHGAAVYLTCLALIRARGVLALVVGGGAGEEERLAVHYKGVVESCVLQILLQKVVASHEK